MAARSRGSTPSTVPVPIAAESSSRKRANRDWEDLSSFRIGALAYLLVADTGDNDAKRKHVQLYVVPEPDLDLDDKVKVEPAWKVDFVYPGGPRDAEAVAVDTANQRVLVLTKRTLPPELYEVPLTPGDGRAKAKCSGPSRVCLPPLATMSRTPASRKTGTGSQRAWTCHRTDSSRSY